MRSSKLLAHVGDNSDENQKGSTRTLQDTLKRKGSDLDNDDNSPKRKVLKETEQEPTHSSASNPSSSNSDEVDEKVKAGDSVDGTHTAVAQAKLSMIVKPPKKSPIKVKSTSKTPGPKITQFFSKDKQ